MPPLVLIAAVAVLVLIAESILSDSSAQPAETDADVNTSSIPVPADTSWFTDQQPANGVQALAIAIGVAEGWGTDGAIPTLRNNPGDLELGSDSTITTFPTLAQGLAALLHQLTIIQAGTSHVYDPNGSIQDMANKYAPSIAGYFGQNSAWATNVANKLTELGYPATPDTSLAEIFAL